VWLPPALALAAVTHYRLLKGYYNAYMACTNMSSSSFKKLTSTAVGVGIDGTVKSSRTFGMSLQVNKAN